MYSMRLGRPRLTNLQPVATNGPTPKSIIGTSRHRHSPASSPHKLGKKGPKRRRTVSVRKLATRNINLHTQATNQPNSQTTTLTIECFTENKHDKTELTKLMTKLHAFNIEKFAVEDGMVLNDFRNCLQDTQSDTLVSSRVYYMELVDENPDTNETMMLVAEDLLDKFDSQGSVLLVGDGKTYQHLMHIKNQYGDALSKLFIFPGDWHTLKNYQETMMKVYYTAGLRDIAKQSGYHGKTLASLETCSNFKRTHNFLLQVWEALYREILCVFSEHNPRSDLQETVRCMIRAAISEDKPANELMMRVLALLEDAQSFSQFHDFIVEQSSKDDTWKFWSQFVFKDCFAYIGLYLAIRGSNWELRIASLKLMTSLFSAFDRDLYQKILPNHLSDIQRYPREILESLQAGGFTVSLNGREWHSVALDEAHEMCINKDLKLATLRPTPSYLQKTSLFFNYRISIYKNFLRQLFPEKYTKSPSQNLTSVIDSTESAVKKEKNVKHMCKVIQQSSLFSIQTNNRGLLNCFTGQKATPEQTHDMLNFRTIGAESFYQFVSHRVLMTPSTNSAPVRQKKLLTMSKPKSTRQRISQRDKEAKLVSKCLRRRLAWCNKTRLPYDLSTEQYSVYPRALSDEHGNPHKSSSKSSWTEKIQSRYNNASDPVLLSSLPLNWTPEAVLIDAMFLINTTPLRRTTSITQYSHLLFNRFALNHFKSGTQEVHFIFDTPNNSFNPKIFEQSRRDAKTKSAHQHQDFTPNTSIPPNWREFINCRQCKQSIIQSIGLAFLQTGSQLLQLGQNLVLAGCFGEGCQDSWTISTERIPQPSPQYRSNSAEADSRIWRHATQSSSTRILIYSPDTDVYNIGLTVPHTNREYIVQLNVPHAQAKKYIYIKNLIRALVTDPDLASLQSDKIASTLQILFICTGCDYISYFKTIGKATFWNIFFQHSQFITGSQTHGQLHETDQSSNKNGFLAFIRLVGTAYFKKHLAAFISTYSLETPIQLFHSIDATLSIEDHHRKWLETIRIVVAERIISEEERVPSYTSLWRHWLRSCWCAQLWKSASLENINTNMLPPELCGWIKDTDEAYSIDWEDPSIQNKIKGTIEFLIKGCACKKGCKSNRCKCYKKGDHCGPGCECQGCVNIPIDQPEAASSDSESDPDPDTDNEDGSSVASSESEECLETELVTLDEILSFDLLENI